MKLFIIGSLLLGGTGVAAAQNETVQEGVTNVYKSVRNRVRKETKENAFDYLKENGFPYPNEERLLELTEEQQTAILTAIDQVNATYNWAEMTDVEITEALELVQADFVLLAEELGLEVSDNFLFHGFHRKVRRETREEMKSLLIENIRETGLEYPNEDRLANLTEDQAQAIMDKIDELNTTYDWANMTDEEILDALSVVRDELRTLREELGIEIPAWGRRGRHRRTPEAPTEDVVDGSDV